MNCQKVQALIIDFLEKRLKPDVEKSVLLHVAECIECRFVYQDERQKIDIKSHINPLRDDQK